MSEVRIIEPHEMERWDNFVLSHKFGSIYHTSLWKEIIENISNYRHIYIIIEDGKKDIISGLPLFLINSKITGNRLSSVPCAHYCNPLVSNQEEYNRLIDFVFDIKKRNNFKYLELKTSNTFKLDSSIFGEVFNGYSSYILDLGQPIENIKSSFHKSCVQRAIKKSYKSNIELVVGESIDDVRKFYNLYFKMRKSNGLLPQPFELFSSMWETMFKKNHIEILHAKYDNSIISSILMLKYNDTAIYEYGASMPEMLNLRPVHFLLWEAIKRSKVQGYKKFDFGRTENENEGLSRFKMRWGTRCENLSYYYIPQIYGFSSARQKKLTKDVMHYSMKYMPDSLCYLMGKLLYKYMF